MSYTKSRFLPHGFAVAAMALTAFFPFTQSVFAAPGETLIVDGTTSTNSTLSCAGKTVCHLTGDLTYANVILKNGGKLSHRLGTLTVTNDFVVGTGSTVAGYYVGQNVSVGHLLQVTTSSVFSLNMQNTDPAAATNITDWMSTSWYDLQVTNTDTNYNGLDINVTNACVSGGGGTTLPSCFRTRNTNVNSSAKLVGNATSVALQTYSNGYFAIDGNFDVSNSHVLVDGYLQVRKDFKVNFGGAYILAVKGGVLATVPANALGFTQAGLYVGQSLMMTGTAAYPDLFMSGANGSAADNIYVENDFTAYRMQIGGTSQTAADSPNNIMVKTGKMTLNDINYFSAGGNIYSYLAMNGTTITNFNTNNLTSGFNSIGFVSVTSMKTNAVTGFGTGWFQAIGTLDRSGDYTFTGSIDFNNVTTSNGAATNVTSKNGYVKIITGTTHTYQDISLSTDIDVSGITNLTTRKINALWNGVFSSIATLQRTGDYVFTGSMTFNSVTTSNGAATNLTSIQWAILISTGTTHTYQDISSLNGLTVNNVTNLTIRDNASTSNGLVINSASGVTIRDIATSSSIVASTITNLTTRKINAQWNGVFSSINTLQRTGDYVFTGSMTFNNVTTSSGAATNLTAIIGSINISTGTTHTYQDITLNGDINVTNLTNLTTRAVNAVGNGAFTSIGTMQRTGHYVFTGSLTYTGITSCSGTATDITSSYGYMAISNVPSFTADQITIAQYFTVGNSTLGIINATDKNDEGAPNIDVSVGSGFILTNSTANLPDSSIQVNGYFELNNTTWKSQNLNVNGYTTLNGEKVGMYFRGGKDRYIAGSIFAGGWSIWVGTWNGTGATTPDDGNIFLTRKAAITTNGAIKVYRSNTATIDNSATAPWTTPTINTSLISQFYNAALQANGGVVQVLTGSTTGTGYINDGSNTNGYDSTTAGTVIRTSFSRPMIISKICVLQHNGGTYTPENLKLQFRNTAGSVINTQAVKLGSKTSSRTCYDVNTYEANSIDTSSYPTTQISLKELEFWGVPRDLANVNSSFDSDMLYKNGVYEFGGILSTKNMYVYSDTGKKFYAIQYHNNGTFSSRQNIELNSTDASGSVFTHSVGNELGLRFVTDSMKVGTNVVLDATNKGYLGGNADSAPVVSATNGLYSFSSHTFTNCWQAGQYGPTLATCKTAYSAVTWAQNASYLNMVTQGIQEWTVPRTGTYTIEALGANGGRGTAQGRGWDGAYLRGDFALTQGDVIQILVGQVGPTGNSNDGGGGGGTFVVKKSGTVPLIIAGGGGGGSYSNPGYGYPASTSTSGNPGTNGGSGWAGWAGGTSAGCAGAGAWFSGNGWNGPSCWGVNGGASFTNGGQWGNTVSNATGGFWGGGGTHGGGWGGGGGGGYSGGGASTSSQYGGGGGGSYNAGSNTYAAASSSNGWYNMQDANSQWNGKVVVTFNDPGPSGAELAGGTGSITPGSVRMGAWDGGGNGFIGWYGVSAGGGGGGWALYSFSSHTFTNCSATLSTGPTLASCKTAYSAVPWAQSAAYLGMNTQGIQEWTVPQTGTYRIDAYGAWYPSYGGGGAQDRGDFFLLKGQKVKILVWQKWHNWNGSDTAGAGWSFVTTYDNKPLVVAWGGWASYTPTKNYQQSAGGYAMIVGWVWYDNGWQPINGGSNGNGWSCGSTYTTCQWGGGGFYTDGTNTTYGGWKSFISWGLGGCYSYCGWFGGGGGTTSWYGGGGGGYSGGGAGYNGSSQSYWYGGGGGSYNNGTNPIHTAGTNGGQWYVTISFVPGNTTLASAAAGGGNLGYGWYGGGACAGKIGNNTLGNTKGGDGGGALGWSGSNWHGGGGAYGCTGGGGGTGGNSDANPYRLWSGGGAGQLVTDNTTNGFGGNGGWMIRISTNSLQITGKLVANGQVGKDALLFGGVYAGAGGGWAGWSILIRAKTLNCSTGNAFDVKGGAGGAGSASTAGGGGGGGWVVAYYYTTKTGSCNYALTQGSAGASGGGADGQVGILYESVGTTFDTLKSRVVVENSPAQADGTSQITIRAYFLDVNGVPLESEYLVAEVVGSLGTGKINGGNPLPQTDANGMIAFPITSTSKGIKKVILKNAVTYTELQEQPTITFGVPQISIAKVANKTTINSGDVVTYTISLTNSGSGDAGGDAENAIVVEDVLPTGFQYYPTGPTAGTKWDTGSGTSQYFLFPETSGDGTSGNEVRLKYVIGDGISGPPVIAGSGGLIRIIFDSRAP